MAKVYVLNDMNHNFDNAKRFGELVYVTQGKVPIFKTDVVTTMLSDGLKEFTNEDYLLVAGPPILGVMAVLILARSKVCIKTLLFDAKEQDYVVRHLYS